MISSDAIQGLLADMIRLRDAHPKVSAIHQRMAKSIGDVRRANSLIAKAESSLSWARHAALVRLSKEMF